MSATATPPFRNLVGGELVDGVEGATRDVLSPATGEVIGRVPDGTQADVERAMAAARAARIPWRDTTPGQRMEALLALADAIDAHAGELAALAGPDALAAPAGGRPARGRATGGRRRSRAAGGLPFCADGLRFFAGAARTMPAPAAGEYGAGYTSIVRREPVGIVGQIAPWN